MSLITLSIPLFFLLMGVEWLCGRLRGRRVFRGPDVFANLSLGSAQTIFSAVAVGLLAGAYKALYPYRLLDISPASPLAWAALLLGVDFAYYWFHRVSHRTVKPVGTFNPLVAALVPFRELAALSRRTPRWLDKVKLWLMPPEWRPPGVDAAVLAVTPGRPRFDVSLSRRVALYVGLVGVLTLIVTVLFLVRSASLSLPARLSFAGWFLASMGGLGGVLEGRRWAPKVEAVRLAAAPLLLVTVL